jgi:signal transduction histidine kinase/DNA-binding response OmpR family regulator/HPt (histidine-containing phosphotransfer) domain-containing protein
MKTAETRHRILGITMRTALLSWMVTIATLLIFVTVIIPQQKRTFEENLDSKAQGVAVALRDSTAGAAINEDFSTLVEQCTQMLVGDKSLDYLVIGRKDGHVLFFEKGGKWTSGEEGTNSVWLPKARKASGGIGPAPHFGRRVYRFSQPFDYTGIEWGWIHVGLSLESYDANVATVYRHTLELAIGCLALGFLASIVYARRLVRPILTLRKVVEKVAGGDLSVRAGIEGGDELASLAGSVNSMTEALLRRDEILQSVRFAAQEFLSSLKWDEVIGKVLAKLGGAADASRVYVFENHPGGSGAVASSKRFEWSAPGVKTEISNPALQNFSWSGSGLTGWADQLGRSECVSSSSESWTPPERAVLEPLGVRSTLLIPIRVENVWWGFLGLDECRNSRVWTAAEQDSLRAAAGMLGAAITRQRTQDALLRAKEAAESASQAKSQFLANMSHEIRTPITGVIGMLRLLQRTALDQKQHRYVSNTMASADSLLTVIGDVLDFSKIEAGKLELEESVFAVADTLDVAVRLLADKAEAKGLEVACRVAGNVPRHLVGDSDRLRQVLLNLISNAVKFTEQGTVVVSCALAESSDTAVTLRFEVKDTGPGIASQQQEQIFEAFCQADSSMSRTHGGTGLGLTICRQLVRLMQGHIAVESVRGQGSTFWFTARFKPAPVVDDPASAQPLVDFHGLRVLVVDNCPVVREIVCDYVRTWKGAADEAPEAATALDKLRRAAAKGEPFAVAVIDWQMPGLNGFELARLVKQDPALRATALVLLSSFTQASAALDHESAEFAAWLPKPARKSELYDAIIRAANGRLSHLRSLPPAAPGATRGAVEKIGTGTVLLAEDNEINQEVASEMLAALGYNCVRVWTGAEALASVKTGGADLVLMDCQMPEMDGYEATRRIRQWEQEQAADGRRERHLPIVALTAHAMKGDRARCLESGMDDYMTKPLEPEGLAKTLARWMPRSPAASPRPDTTLRADAIAKDAIAKEAAPPKTAVVPNARPEPDSTVSSIDFPSLLERCMGKRDLARRLVEKFMVQGAADLRELETAIRDSDAARVKLVAHRLKGAAANVSAEAVRHCASRLETLGRDGDLAAAPGNLAELRVLVEATRQPAD